MMMRWLSRAGIDPFTMNVYRMFTGSLCLVPFGIWFNREGMKKAAARPWKFVLPALLFAVSMVLWVYALTHLGATVASLVGRVDVIFAVLIGMLFFADERSVVMNRWFLISLLVAMTGVTGVIIFRDEALLSGSVYLEKGFWTGIALSLGASFFWVTYIYSVKRMVKRIGAVVSFIMVTVEAAFIMLAVAMVVDAYGGANLRHPWSMGLYTNAILWISGIFGVGIGGILFYRSMDLVGVAVSQTSTLTLPFLTGLTAFIFLGEQLTPRQLISGLVLLAGLVYVVVLRIRQVDTEPAEAEDLSGPT